jgi:hypothetical protein
VLQGEVQQRVQELFADIAEQYDITIEEGEFWEDGYFARTVGDKVTAEVIRRKRGDLLLSPLWVITIDVLAIPWPRRLEQRVDKGGHSRALGQDEQHPEEHQNRDNWQEPKLLPLSHKRPEFYDKFTHF